MRVLHRELVLLLGAGAALLAMATPSTAAPTPLPTATTRLPTAVTPLPTDAADDVHTVYCLAKERRTAVVEAADRLGAAKRVKGKPELLTVPPRTKALTVEQWAKEGRPEFRRVCAALMQAESNQPAAPSSGGGNVREALLSGGVLAVLGAGLTLAGGASERSSARRRQRTESLDGATIRFSLTAERYLGAWQSERNTPYGELDTARTELSVALRGFGATGSRREAALALADSLPLAQPLEDTVHRGAQGSRPLKEEEKQAEVRRQRSRLASAVYDADRLTASALVWHVGRLRRSPRGGENS